METIDLADLHARTNIARAKPTPGEVRAKEALAGLPSKLGIAADEGRSHFVVGKLTGPEDGLPGYPSEESGKLPVCAPRSFGDALIKGVRAFGIEPKAGFGMTLDNGGESWIEIRVEW